MKAGAIAEYPVEIEAGGRASRLRVKFLRWLDQRTRQFHTCGYASTCIKVKIKVKGTSVRIVLWRKLDH